MKKNKLLINLASLPLVASIPLTFLSAAVTENNTDTAASSTDIEAFKTWLQEHKFAFAIGGLRNDQVQKYTDQLNDGQNITNAKLKELTSQANDDYNMMVKYYQMAQVNSLGDPESYATLNLQADQMYNSKQWGSGQGSLVEKLKPYFKMFYADSKDAVNEQILNEKIAQMAKDFEQGVKSTTNGEQFWDLFNAYYKVNTIFNTTSEEVDLVRHSTSSALVTFALIYAGLRDNYTAVTDANVLNTEFVSTILQPGMKMYKALLKEFEKAFGGLTPEIYEKSNTYKNLTTDLQRSRALKVINYMNANTKYLANVKAANFDTHTLQLGTGQLTNLLIALFSNNSGRNITLIQSMQSDFDTSVKTDAPANYNYYANELNNLNYAPYTAQTAEALKANANTPENKANVQTMQAIINQYTPITNAYNTIIAAYNELKDIINSPLYTQATPEVKNQYLQAWDNIKSTLDLSDPNNPKANITISNGQISVPETNKTNILSNPEGIAAQLVSAATSAKNNLDGYLKQAQDELNNNVKQAQNNNEQHNSITPEQAVKIQAAINTIPNSQDSATIDKDKTFLQKLIDDQKAMNALNYQINNFLSPENSTFTVSPQDLQNKIDNNLTSPNGYDSNNLSDLNSELDKLNQEVEKAMESEKQSRDKQVNDFVTNKDTKLTPDMLAKVKETLTNSALSYSQFSNALQAVQNINKAYTQLDNLKNVLTEAQQNTHLSSDQKQTLNELLQQVNDQIAGIKLDSVDNINATLAQLNSNITEDTNSLRNRLNGIYRANNSQLPQNIIQNFINTNQVDPHLNVLTANFKSYLSAINSASLLNEVQQYAQLKEKLAQKDYLKYIPQDVLDNFDNLLNEVKNYDSKTPKEQLSQKANELSKTFTIIRENIYQGLTNSKDTSSLPTAVKNAYADGDIEQKALDNNSFVDNIQGIANKVTNNIAAFNNLKHLVSVSKLNNDSDTSLSADEKEQNKNTTLAYKLSSPEEQKAYDQAFEQAQNYVNNVDNNTTAKLDPTVIEQNSTNLTTAKNNLSGKNLLDGIDAQLKALKPYLTTEAYNALETQRNNLSSMQAANEFKTSLQNSLTAIESFNKLLNDDGTLKAMENLNSFKYNDSNINIPASLKELQASDNSTYQNALERNDVYSENKSFLASNQEAINQFYDAATNKFTNAQADKINSVITNVDNKAKELNASIATQWNTLNDELTTLSNNANELKNSNAVSQINDLKTAIAQIANKDISSLPTLNVYKNLISALNNDLYNAQFSPENYPNLSSDVLKGLINKVTSGDQALQATAQEANELNDAATKLKNAIAYASEAAQHNSTNPNDLQTLIKNANSLLANGKLNSDISLTDLNKQIDQLTQAANENNKFYYVQEINKLNLTNEQKAELTKQIQAANTSEQLQSIMTTANTLVGADKNAKDALANYQDFVDKNSAKLPNAYTSAKLENAYNTLKDAQQKGFAGMTADQINKLTNDLNNAINETEKELAEMGGSHFMFWIPLLVLSAITFAGGIIMYIAKSKGRKNK
ncbi:hypothetical protein ACM0IS_02380 [Mycoplasma aquilae ATCC BAA-1896]|uniref:hypothetical protein n=1 Tax=Mycoplasma aquilae TaxID=1312741 RepID=UPI003A8C0C52